MKDDPITDGSLRQFLLGQLDDEQRQRIESLFLTDPEFKDRLLAVEQDLIDDYLEDCLATADRDNFLLQFTQTPEQQRKLRITKTVKDWVKKEANRQQPIPPAISVWGRLLAGLRLKPVFVIAVTVMAVTAMVVSVFLLNYRAGRRNLNTQEELARLNDPTNLREAVPPEYSLELYPVAVRSAESEPEVNISNTHVVELRLRWIRETYPRYRAVIKRFDTDETFTADNLRGVGEAGEVIPLRLPVTILRRGLYRIELSGVNANGGAGDMAEYKFNVSG